MTFVDIRSRTGFVTCAMFATLVVYIGIHAHEHWWAPLPPDVSGFESWPAWRFKLFASGGIPYAILWCFLFGTLYLVQLWFLKFLPLGVSNQADEAVLAAVRSQDDGQLVEALNAQVNKEVAGYYGHRLLLMRKRYEEDHDLTAIQSMKDDILANDEDEIAISFNAVAWAEWALPMLGFLGTVVGIGFALGGIQAAVGLLFSGGQSPEMKAKALAKFNEGFAGLGVAFDTTFLGLIFLLVLGLLKMSLKKMIGARLANARSVFFDAVSMWRTGDGSTGLIAAIGGLQNRIRALERIAHEGEQQATDYREGVKSMALSIVREHSALTEAKRILFRPVVEFRDRGKQVSALAQEFLLRECSAPLPAIVSIAPSLTNANDVAFNATRAGGMNIIARLDLAAGKATEGLVKGTDAERLVGFESDARVLVQRKNKDVVVLTKAGVDQTVVEEKYDGVLFPVLVDGERGGVVWVRSTGASTRVSIGAFGESRGREEALDQHYKWHQFSVWRRSASCFFVGGRTVGGGSVLQVWSPRGKASNGDQLRLRLTGVQQLTIDPIAVEAIGHDEAVILDADGQLHYWRRSAQGAVRLHHAAWSTDAHAIIRAGGGGWIAVAANDRLRMWQVTRGGNLFPYEADTSFDITGVRRDTFVATADGSVLLAADRDGHLIGWDFPRLESDGW